MAKEIIETFGLEYTSVQLSSENHAKAFKKIGAKVCISIFYSSSNHQPEKECQFKKHRSMVNQLINWHKKLKSINKEEREKEEKSIDY